MAPTPDIDPDDDEKTTTDQASAPPRSAAAAVHGVAELLEMIIVHLPPPQVLTSQRVSKQFRNVIIGSPVIQKTLFATPTTDYLLHLQGCGIRPKRCSDAWTCIKPAEAGVYAPVGPLRWTRSEEDLERYNIIVNPFIKATKHAQRNVDFSAPANTAAAMMAGASWRNMLLTQPPVQELVVDHMRACHWHIIKASDPSRGVTLGDLDKSMVAFSTAEDRCEEITVAYAEEWDVLSSERTDPRPVLDMPCWELAEEVLKVLAKRKSTLETQE